MVDCPSLPHFFISFHVNFGQINTVILSRKGSHILKLKNRILKLDRRFYFMESEYYVLSSGH